MKDSQNGVGENRYAECIKVRWRRVNVTSGCATTVCITDCLHFDRIRGLVMRRIEECAQVGVDILYCSMACNETL